MPPGPSTRGPLPPPPPGGDGPTTFRAPGAATDPAYLPAQDANLGFATMPVGEVNGPRGLRVTSLVPETVAANAGLRPGDIIVSANGYRTEQAGNLAWIMAHAMGDHTLTMNVLQPKDGKEHTIRVELPVLRPINTSRPDYLPAVGYGPPPATR